jgi:hypothetical protein
MIDFSDSEVRKQIADSLIVDIDSWSEQKYTEAPRRHLGASIIGKPCSRELWYAFRWAKRDNYASGNKPAGQSLRLFQRGHKEEFSFIEYFEGIGCKFLHTPEDQARVSDCSGHFGGSLDNIGYLPPKFEYLEKVLFEFKTSNMANFNTLKKNGLHREKPVHHAQMCTYGFKMGIEYGVYCVVDKNTDELYIELVKLDLGYGKTMVDKALAIITAPHTHPPAKISMSISNFACKWCNFKDVCHNGEAVEINCRSCVNAVPLEDGKWGCRLYGEIPTEVIPKGCPQHKGIN